MDGHPALRRLVRAACVIDGLGAEPTSDGVLVPGCPCGALVSWTELAGLLGDDDPVHPAPRRRLALLIELHRAVQRLGPAAAGALTGALRPLALPAGHALHPGEGWVREQVPGGVLGLGLGVWRLLPGQDDAVPLPPTVAAAAGLPSDDAWRALRPLTERVADFAVDRAEGAQALPRVLPGVGGTDALTLLGLEPVRRWLVTAHGGDGGTAMVSVPRRDRAWWGPGATDQDYARAVWLLTSPTQRGILAPISVSTTRVAITE